MAHGVDVDAGRCLFAVGALEGFGETAGELDVLDAPGDLAAGVVTDLSMLGGEPHGDLIGVGDDQVAEVVEEPGASGDRDVAPFIEGRLGRGDRTIDLLDRREADLAGLVAGGGVRHRAGPTGSGGDVLTVDQVVNLLHVCSGQVR